MNSGGQEGFFILFLVAISAVSVLALSVFMYVYNTHPSWQKSIQLGIAFLTVVTIAYMFKRGVHI